VLGLTDSDGAEILGWTREAFRQRLARRTLRQVIRPGFVTHCYSDTTPALGSDHHVRGRFWPTSNAVVPRDSNPRRRERTRPRLLVRAVTGGAGRSACQPKLASRPCGVVAYSAAGKRRARDTLGNAKLTMLK
jgi:hypothetical protein